MIQVSSRRGSYMAEAAVVLPMVILAIITVVLILMFFYEESVEQSRLHMDLRQKAAVAAGRLPEEYATTGGTSDDLLSGNPAVLEVSRKGVFRNVHGYVYVHIISRGLLSGAKESKLEGSWHAVSGAKFRRLFDYQGVL